MRLTDLLHRRIQSHGGKALGRIFDLRCERGDPTTPATVVELVYGARGWLESLGIGRTQSSAAPAESIRRIDDIVVIDDTRARPVRR